MNIKQLIDMESLAREIAQLDGIDIINFLDSLADALPDDPNSFMKRVSLTEISVSERTALWCKVLLKAKEI